MSYHGTCLIHTHVLKPCKHRKTNIECMFFDLFEHTGLTVRIMGLHMANQREAGMFSRQKSDILKGNISLLKGL